jgi:hypothetical protein
VGRQVLYIRFPIKVSLVLVLLHFLYLQEVQRVKQTEACL